MKSFQSPLDISNPDNGGNWWEELPAVSVVMGAGFMVECAPVVCFESRFGPMAYALLTYEQRGKIRQDIPNLDALLEEIKGKYVLINDTEREGRWGDLRNQWVSIPWLASLPEPKSPRQRIMFKLIQALQKAAEQQESGREQS